MNPSLRNQHNRSSTSISCIFLISLSLAATLTLASIYLYHFNAHRKLKLVAFECAATASDVYRRWYIQILADSLWRWSASTWELSSNLQKATSRTTSWCTSAYGRAKPATKGMYSPAFAPTCIKGDSRRMLLDNVQMCHVSLVYWRDKKACIPFRLWICIRWNRFFCWAYALTDCARVNPLVFFFHCAHRMDFVVVTFENGYTKTNCKLVVWCIRIDIRFGKMIEGIAVAFSCEIFSIHFRIRGHFL